MQRWPAFRWLASYDPRQNLQGDVRAGITVAVMLIPQGLAYAMLAGLPPVVGLYSAVFPLLAYAAFGTSRQLAVGPVAMDSLLVAVGVAAIAPTSSAEYVAAATILAALVGGLQVAMGALRLGFLVNFLSQPVVNGFTSAAAVIIGSSQLPHLLGVRLETSARTHEVLSGLLTGLEQTHAWTAGLGLGSVAVLLLLKRYAPRVPAALLLVALATLLSFSLGLEHRGVTVVGGVPAGLPGPTLTLLDAERITALLPTAVTIALVGFLEAISVAKVFASKNGYEVSANRELVSLGLANLAAYLFRGYPVTGGFSRTAVNAEAGARSLMASVISAAVVALALWKLTPLFTHLPKAALAAIVLVAVGGLVDVRAPARLWRIKPTDAALVVVTFGLTLALGMQLGIAGGVLVSLGLFIYRTTRPHTAELGRLPGTEVYRNLKNFPEAQAVPGLLILRVDASFYFGNVAFFKDRLDALLRERPHEVCRVLLDASSINDLDSSAEQALREAVRRLRANGKDLYLANVKGPVREVMKRAGLWGELGEDHIFLDIHSAVQRIGAVSNGL